MALAQPDIESSLPPPGIPLQDQDWIHLASGFSRLLWSVPAGLFLFTGAIEFRWPHFIQLPSYILAAGLYFWGIVILLKVKAPSPAWKRSLRTAAVLGLLLFYFAPFIYWWERQPDIDHLAVNVFAMAFTLTWILWTLNDLAERVSLQLQDIVLLIEARLCRWSVLLFMTAPLLAFFVYAVFGATRFGIPLGHFLADARYLPYAHLVLALFILPLTLTLAITWKTKQRALAQVITGGSQS